MMPMIVDIIWGGFMQLVGVLWTAGSHDLILRYDWLINLLTNGLPVFGGGNILFTAFGITIENFFDT